MDDRSFNLRILLIDDQTLVRQALASLIQSVEGMEIVGTAGTIADAVQFAEQWQPHLVLLDVLPEIGVWEGAREISRRCPDTKIILLDDAPLDANVREALRMNAAGYLTKQQPFSQVENALRQAARGDRVFAPEIARRLVLSNDGVHLAVEKTDDPLSTLTPRETDVLIHLAQGYSVKQCAKLLGIGTSTVGNHKSRLMKKLDIHKTVELTRLAMRNSLIPSGGPIRQPNSKSDWEASL